MEQELDKGVPPDRMAYLAFTRKAAQEAVHRATTKFKIDKKRFTLVSNNPFVCVQS